MDAALIVRQLRAAGFEPEVTRVQTATEFRASLRAQPPWDVILSDHALPGYGGIEALSDLRATGQDVPFILVSGAIGEEVAVEAMRAGAVDYVLKRDLPRLPAAVTRGLRDKAARAESARMRERLELADRMASVGTLAAGVAHEINNPLAIAVANVDLVTEAVSRVLDAEAAGAPVRLGELHELEDQLRDAREALARIRNIVRDIRLFSRPGEEATHPVDLRRVIESSLRMAYSEVRHRARLVTDHGAVPPVRGSESRLGQVLINLVVNAAQAIPEGRAEENEIRVTTRAMGSSVVIEVKDTGAGISPDRVGRIFEPFYTTKPVGVGTGLGLAICHRIVTELHGTIEVESEPGAGSLFRVILPAADAGTPLVARAVSAVTLAPRAMPRARILVVDDEVPIGVALKRVLGEHHDVLPVTCGRDALARVAAGERFDVILSDLLMPDMSGIELYERLRQAAPDQADRTVFLTGAAYTPAARDFLDRVPNPRIEKPFEPANLMAIIAGVTGRRDPSRTGEVEQA